MALTLDGTNGIVSSGAISSSSNITATGTITTQSATGVIFSDSSNQGAAASPFSLKNRIINGDMVIDQRNSGASITGNNGAYGVDRWVLYATQSSKLTCQQNQGSVTPPAGFTNYLGYTSSSAYTVGASDYFSLTQPIEGFNVADLAWGTANARTVTLSFWVRSSLTGTFGGALRNADVTRTYPFSYTISSANTWEYKTITIPGDTSGTWNRINGYGLGININLGAGATVSGPAGAWANTFYCNASSTVNLVGTNNATFYITGVQLERNTTATPFEWIPYGMELALCQRYYQRLGSDFLIPLYNENTTSGRAIAFYPVTMRAAPTSLEQSGTASDYNVRTFSSGKNCTSVPSLDRGITTNIFITANVSTGVGAAGGAGNLNGNNSNAFLAWSAEL